MTRVVAYLRVSTDRQAEEGLGLEIQEGAIRRWARAHDHRVVAWTRDEGISGSNGLENRQALPEAIGLLRDRRAAGLVVYRLDRLARDLIVQETLLAEIRRAGGEAFTTSAAEQGYLADDPEDPSRRLIRQVLGAVSEYERAMITLRLASGRRRKHERGGFAYGSPPYGWTALDGELVPVPEEQEALALIADLRSRGASLRQIAAVLQASPYRPRRSEIWHIEVISQILRRLEGRAA